MVVERPCRAAAALLFLVLPLMASGTVRAGGDDLFTVARVKVDATADTAAAAREVALAEGQGRALGLLLRRLTLGRDHAGLPAPPNHRVAELVQALEIAHERTSAVRYLAELTVRFKAEEVRLLLRQANVRFAETVRRPELVLPVYVVAGAPLLWDEPNPWKDAWAARPAGASLVPLTVPIGDLSDMSEVSAEEALRGDVDRLDAIARRYDTGGAMVAIATLALDPVTNLPGLTVIARRHGADAGAYTVVELRIEAGGQGIDVVLADAVDAVASELEEAWKRDNLLRFDLRGRLLVSVPVGGIEEWVEVRRRLGRIAAIRHTELRALTRNQGWLSLSHVGEVRQLALALAQQDLELRQGLGAWTLRLRAAPGQAATALPAAVPPADEAAASDTGQRPGPLPDRPLFQNPQ